MFSLLSSNSTILHLRYIPSLLSLFSAVFILCYPPVHIDCPCTVASPLLQIFYKHILLFVFSNFVYFLLHVRHILFLIYIMWWRNLCAESDIFLCDIESKQINLQTLVSDKKIRNFFALIARCGLKNLCWGFSKKEMYSLLEKLSSALIGTWRNFANNKCFEIIHKYCIQCAWSYIVISTTTKNMFNCSLTTV